MLTKRNAASGDENAEVSAYERLKILFLYVAGNFTKSLLTKAVHLSMGVKDTVFVCVWLKC